MCLSVVLVYTVVGKFVQLYGIAIVHFKGVSKGISEVSGN